MLSNLIRPLKNGEVYLRILVSVIILILTTVQIMALDVYIYPNGEMVAWDDDSDYMGTSSCSAYISRYFYTFPFRTDYTELHASSDISTAEKASTGETNTGSYTVTASPTNWEVNLSGSFRGSFSRSNYGYSTYFGSPSEAGSPGAQARVDPDDDVGCETVHLYY